MIKAILNDDPQTINDFYPKVVVETNRVITSGAVELAENEERFLEPPDAGFGIEYVLMSHRSNDAGWLVYYEENEEATVLLYNTSTGQSLDYSFFMGSDFETLSNDPKAYLLNDTFWSYSPYYGGIYDMGDVYFGTNPPMAVSKTTGDFVWHEKDWYGNGVEELYGDAVLVDADKMWVFYGGSPLLMINLDGSFLSLTLEESYENMFSLPDGSVALCPYAAPGGPVARVHFDGTSLVIDTAWGAGIDLDWGMHPFCNVHHGENSFYISSYDYINAYNLSDGSLKWTFPRSRFTDSFAINPLNGNVITDEEFGAGCKILELDKDTGAVVGSTELADLEDMSTYAMSSDGILFMAEDTTPQRMGFLDLSDGTYTAVPPYPWSVVGYQFLPLVTANSAYFPTDTERGLLCVDFSTLTTSLVRLKSSGKALPEEYFILSSDDDGVLFNTDGGVYKLTDEELDYPQVSHLNPTPSGLPSGYYKSGETAWGPSLLKAYSNTPPSTTIDAPSSTSPLYITMNSGYGSPLDISEMYDGMMKYKGSITSWPNPTTATQHEGFILGGFGANKFVATTGATSNNSVRLIDATTLTEAVWDDLPGTGTLQDWYGSVNNSGEFVLLLSRGTGNVISSYKSTSGTWTSLAPLPVSARYFSAVFNPDDGLFYVMAGPTTTTSVFYSFNDSTNTWTELTAPTMPPNTSHGLSSRSNDGVYHDGTVYFPRFGLTYSAGSWGVMEGWDYELYSTWLVYAKGMYLGSSDNASPVIYIGTYRPNYLTQVAYVI